MVFAINQTNQAINEHTIKDPHLFEEWFKYGLGPLTVPIGDGIGYIRAPSGNPVEISLHPLGFEPNTFATATSLQQPGARGRVTLNSKDPWDKPIMSYDYFGNNTDLKDNIYAVKFLVKLVEETEAFKEVAPKLIPYPKCKHVEFKSDDYWTCVSKYLIFTNGHQVNTCGMGHVVNSDLQVLGIRRLRVVDSSIIPQIPTAHMYAPTLMIGEKAADLIKSTWPYK